MPDLCPLCGADLTGDPIPPEHREHYGDHTHYSRRLTRIDQDRDRAVEHLCPDCGGTWPVGDGDE